mmetsp:Transcript_15441/g.36472  ORF Transcript_15441/g.36472 Transcript_15441/m.36472 type:complete len:203 (-) Transcript_15441:131-739(-)
MLRLLLLGDHGVQVVPGLGLHVLENRKDASTLGLVRGDLRLLRRALHKGHERLLLPVREGGRVHDGAQGLHQILRFRLLQQRRARQLLGERLDGAAQHVGGIFQLRPGGSMLRLLFAAEICRRLLIRLALGDGALQLLQSGPGDLHLRAGLFNGRAQLLHGLRAILDVIAEISLAPHAELGVVVIGLHSSLTVLLHLRLEVD